MAQQETNSNRDRFSTHLDEQSLTFKIFLVKFKCILLFTFALLTFIEFVFIIATNSESGGDPFLNITALSAQLAKIAGRVTL
jgi:hypothetical protein